MSVLRSARGPELQPESAYHVTQRGLPHIAIDGTRATITHLRDGIYLPDRSYELRSITQTVDLAEMTNVHFMLNGGWGAIRGVAHAMVCFEFADSKNVVLSIEGLLPHDGKYSVQAGLRRTYPLRNLWQSEADSILSRAYSSNSSIQIAMFELVMTQREAVAFFRSAAARTNELHENPEWYHVVRNSCSTNIARIVDDAFPGHRTRSARYLAPGYLPELFARKGLARIDEADGDVSRLMDRYDVLPLAREIGAADDFSARLHGRTLHGV